MPWGTAGQHTDLIVHVTLNDTDYANSPLRDVIKGDSLRIEILTTDNNQIPVPFGKDFVESSATSGLFYIAVDVPYRLLNHTVQVTDILNIVYYDAAGDMNSPIFIKETAGFLLSDGVLENAGEDDEYAHGEFIYLLLEDSDLNVDSKSGESHVRPIYFIRSGESRPHISYFEKSAQGILFEDVPDVHLIEFVETGADTGVFEAAYRMPSHVKNITLQHKEGLDVQYLDYAKNGDPYHVGFDSKCCYIETGKTVKFQLESRGQYCTAAYILRDGLCWPDVPREKHVGISSVFAGLGNDPTDKELTKKATGVLEITGYKVQHHGKQDENPWFDKYAYNVFFRYQDYGELSVEQIVRVTGKDVDRSYQSTTSFSTERTYESMTPGQALPPGTYKIEMVGRFEWEGRQIYTEPVIHTLIVPDKP